MTEIEVRRIARDRSLEKIALIREAISTGVAPDGSKATIEWLASQASSAEAYDALARLLTPFSCMDGRLL